MSLCQNEFVVIGRRAKCGNKAKWRHLLYKINLCDACVKSTYPQEWKHIVKIEKKKRTK